MYRRENGVYYSDFKTSDGRTVRKSLGTKNEREAKKRERELQLEYDRASVTGNISGVTFEQACVKWLEQKAAKKSLDDDKTYIKYWLTHFKCEPLSSITAEMITKKIAHKQNERHSLNQSHKSDFKPVQISEGTRYHYIKFMRALLRMSVECGYLEKMPVIKVAQPKQKRIRWITREEAKRLIDCCSEPFKQLIIFALATGLRRSNICYLKWSQIDMVRKVAWIHPDEAKAGRAIGVALNETAVDVLKKQMGRHDIFVFINSLGNPFRVDDNSAWRTALKKAGIVDFRFHDLRHTWASWLIQSGVPLGILQEMGAWESIEMVQRYAHLAPSHLTEHAKNIDSILGSQHTVNTHHKFSIV